MKREQVVLTIVTFYWMVHQENHKRRNEKPETQIELGQHHPSLFSFRCRWNLSHCKRNCHFGILYEGFNSNTSFLVQGAFLFLKAYVRSYRHHTDTDEDITTVRKMVAGISVSDSNGFVLFFPCMHRWWYFLYSKNIILCNVIAVILHFCWMCCYSGISRTHTA